jgi:thiol-disulfide isomerase/thioredoxin
MDVLTRALIALLIISGSFGLVWLQQRWARQRLPGLLPGLGPLRPGAFTLVYFTAPSCVPCKTIQRPAIHQVSQRMGDNLQVLEIDATQRPDLASSWGVLSVPTTFVIDPRGSIRHINHGVTRAEQLLTQIHGK